MMTQLRFQTQVLMALTCLLVLTSAYPAEKRKKDCEVREGVAASETEIPDRRADNKAAIGGLFLKHLRFRDLDGDDERREFEKELGLADKDERKRAGSLSVSALADMLSNMRQRQQNAGGVRMQTLRFGRK